MSPPPDLARLCHSHNQKQGKGEGTLAAREPKQKRAEAYVHDEEALLRPEVGTQAQFKKRKPPKTYRYDSSLSPALDWDGQNHARELGEWLLAQITEASKLKPHHQFPESRRYGGVVVSGLDDAVAQLTALTQPFLDWTGKAERLSFDVPTLPLFVHERLSTKAIIETLTGHERDRQMELNLFGDPQLSLADQLDAYEHRGGWVNRLILGDSLAVMNSVLEYEGLGGQVQVIYIDPPYGVKFGSNFQPFVRRRDVKDASDDDLTREPEMVKAYRDTWELGLHSYLTYLRDRFLVGWELLADAGSIFVQIGDANVHHVRELLDEVFGESNFVSEILYRRGGFQTSGTLPSTFDYILWYAKDRSSLKFRPLFVPNPVEDWFAGQQRWIEAVDGSVRAFKPHDPPGPGERVFSHRAAYSATGTEGSRFAVEFEGEKFWPPQGRGWSTNEVGFARLKTANRLLALGKSLRFKPYYDDFPFRVLTNGWTDTVTSGFGELKVYVVQTDPMIVQRCLLMTTDPGDLVLDPTCGSGTTAYVAEQWGRRWITIDTSRVPLALTRQRLLTATYPYYELQAPDRGPAAGFVYKRRQNRKGVEVGGLFPHVTLKSIANDEPPSEQVIVDRPEIVKKVTRVTGPFAVEATIPTPMDVSDGAMEEESPDASFVDRMLETLRRNPSLQLGGNKAITFSNVRVPAQSLAISAEAELSDEGKRVAILLGPENGAVGERLVYEAASEAHMKQYNNLIVIGFAIEPNARALIEKAEALIGIPGTYVQATPDLVMGDLLKTMRSSQLFSVVGLPDVVVRKVAPETKGGEQRYEVELLGLDTFDPTTFEAQHRDGSDVPAWFLDTAWNGLSFHVSQAFFPRTSAWEGLKKALKGEFDDSVWDHLAGTVSAPFTAANGREIAVKVIDDRGNELVITKSLDEAT